MLLYFKITNLTCDACIKLSGLALKKIPGVKRVEIENNGVTVVEADNNITQEEIKKALARVDKSVSFS